MNYLNDIDYKFLYCVKSIQKRDKYTEIYCNDYKSNIFEEFDSYYEIIFKEFCGPKN